MDFESYFRLEGLSIQQQVSIAGYRRSIPATFQQDMYPTHLKSIDELKFLLRSGHNHMWNEYLDELGGFSSNELIQFKESLNRLYSVLNKLFSSEYLNIGIEDLLAQFIVSRTINKLRNFFPVDKFSILEIGPGRGYQAIMCPIYDSSILYKSLDCTPSLYVLQHWIAKIFYGSEFREMANHSLASNTDLLEQDINFEINPCVDLIVNKKQPRIFHYPWWLAGRAFCDGTDLIVCNDALNEMHPESLEYYFYNAYRYLSDRGLFFIQSFGSSKVFGGDLTTKIIKKSGFSFFKRVDIKSRHKDDKGGNSFKLAKAKFILIKKDSIFWSKPENKKLLNNLLNEAWAQNPNGGEYPSISELLADLV